MDISHKATDTNSFFPGGQSHDTLILTHHCSCLNLISEGNEYQRQSKEGHDFAHLGKQIASVTLCDIAIVQCLTNVLSKD